VLLTVEGITAYLDNALGLHLEARTSFIIVVQFRTFQLLAPINLKAQICGPQIPPSVLRTGGISGRISAARHNNRVFMLFKDVAEDQLLNAAQSKAEEGVIWWKGVVGVDVARAGDANCLGF